jgi:hypothetical protein
MTILLLVGLRPTSGSRLGPHLLLQKLLLPLPLSLWLLKDVSHRRRHCG